MHGLMQLFGMCLSSYPGYLIDGYQVTCILKVLGTNGILISHGDTMKQEQTVQCFPI